MCVYEREREILKWKKMNSVNWITNEKEWLWLWGRDNETKTNTDIALRGLDYDSPFPVPEALNTEVHTETPKFTCPSVQTVYFKSSFPFEKNLWK